MDWQRIIGAILLFAFLFALLYVFQLALDYIERLSRKP